MNIYSIYNLGDVISEHLKNGDSLYNLKELLQQYIGTDWNKFVNINDTCYNRNLVFRNEYIDIYIITWKQKQESKIHDHPTHGCLLKVLAGNIIEEIYVKNENEFLLTKTNILSKNDIGFQIGKNGIHKIINSNDEIAVSIHVYSPSGYVPFCYM